MRTVLFDYPGSELGRHEYALSMRLAYMVADKVVYAGDPAAIYNILRPGRTFSDAQRIEAMRYDDNGEKVIEAYKYPLNALKRVKYLNSTALALKKKIDKLIEGYFKLFLGVLGDEFNKDRFLPPEAIHQRPGIFQPLRTNTNPERADKKIPAYSDWLLLQLEEENEGDIVFLSEHFLSHTGLSQPDEPYVPDKPISQGSVYLQQCISLPNLGLMDMVELQYARNHVAEPLALFRQAINGWIDLFVHGDDHTSTRSFFNDTVLPAAEQLQQGWEQCDLLKHINLRWRPEQDYRLYLWLGEVPVQMIWQFFKDNKVIPPATWNRLQQAIAEDDRLSGTWPVMVMRSSTESPDDIVTAHVSSELPTRKSINLS